MVPSPWSFSFTGGKGQQKGTLKHMNKFSGAAIAGYDWRLGREHGGWWEWTGANLESEEEKASAELGGDRTTGTFPRADTVDHILVIFRFSSQLTFASRIE